MSSPSCINEHYSGLPIVRISGVRYYLDTRLRQLREVDNPREYIDLDGEGFVEVEEDDEAA
jgi:hypothetical protein